MSTSNLPQADYTDMFDQMVESEGAISTRGLKDGCGEIYGELVFDVNSAYFYNHGGYDFAKQFYADAYKAAVSIVGGEQYILSAVMHADERNRAMSEKTGRGCLPLPSPCGLYPCGRKRSPLDKALQRPDPGGNR